MKATNQVLISNSGRSLALASLLVGWLLSAFPTTAHADALAKPTNVVAREHLTTGNRLYRVREFEKAITEYKAGAVREDAPVFYYNLGQSYRQLGRYEDAIWHYERFLDRGKPTGEMEVSVKNFIAQMKDELARKAMTQPPIEPAGPPAAGLGSPGQTPPVTSKPSEKRRSLPFRWKLAIGIGGAGVASMSLGIGLWTRARSFKDDAAEICPMTTCARAAEANHLIGRGQTNARYANVAFGVGGAAILGAAIFLIAGSLTEHKTIAIAPDASRDSVSVTASLRF